MNESRVILVPNVPWLKSGTVKDNILFGSAYRKEDYEAVVSACGLREDFKRLPLKDRVRVEKVRSLRMGRLRFSWNRIRNQSKKFMSQS